MTQFCEASYPVIFPLSNEAQVSNMNNTYTSPSKYAFMHFSVQTGEEFEPTLETSRTEGIQARRYHGDNSWVCSTPRSPVPASLHLLALHFKLSLSGLRAP